MQTSLDEYSSRFLSEVDDVTIKNEIEVGEFSE